MTDVRLRLNGIYEIVFSGNIGGVAAGAVQLSISAGNAVLPGSTMISTTAAAGDPVSYTHLDVYKRQERDTYYVREEYLHAR